MPSSNTCKKVAILGATSHIAKNIIFYLSKENQYDLFLFARSPEKMNLFLFENLLQQSCITVLPFEDFDQQNYDVVINCIGIVESTKSKLEQQQLFIINEKYDNIILDYLSSFPSTLYIYLSSGAAYVSSFDTPANSMTKSQIEINNISPVHYYGLTKLYTEAKHRAFSDFNIIDLRIFSFFSRFINMSARFLVNEIIQCLIEKKILTTSSDNIIRDYIHPKDFINVIKLCTDKSNINDVFDIYSCKPITKFELLEYFRNDYGLQYTINKDVQQTSSTGIKINYFSQNKNFLYQPEYSSFESIRDEFMSIGQKLNIR